MAGQIVFRSARSGHKNLYLMDARGEEYGLTRLTAGPWTDTMPEARAFVCCRGPITPKTLVVLLMCRSWGSVAAGPW